MGFITLSSTSTLRFALLVMGFTATASQILIIRELLVTFHGNELFIGIIFGNWLILEAFGSFAMRKRADLTKRHISWFAILQITIGFSLLLSILFIRSFKYLFGIPTGQVLGIHYVAAISLIALAPISLLDGAMFPFGCRNLGIISKKEEASAKVYLYESAGSFVAGIAFVFYLIYYFSPIELAAILISLNLCSAFLYLTSTRGSKTIRNAAMGLMVSVIISFSLSVPKWLHESSSRLLWYEHSLMETRNSVYSNIAIIKGEGQYTFFANGTPYATTPLPEAQVEELAHFPMLFHEQPEYILVIGGGAGGLLKELLKHPVERIDYTEQDPLVIEGFRRFPTPLTEYELNHEKVNIHLLEGRLFLRKTSSLYDLILVNLPIPSTLQVNRYYTVEFFELAKRRLKDRGIFAIKLPGSETFLSKELKELNRTIHASLKAVFPSIRVIAGEQNIFIASLDETLSAITDEMLIERLQSRGVSAWLINEWYLRYKMDSMRFGELEKDIASSEGKIINQDSHPRGMFESMLFLNLVVSPFMVKILNTIGNIPYTHYLLLIIILFIVSLIMQSKKRDLFLTSAIASTGFTSMLTSVLLILSFQVYYGYVYHYIGVLISLFMLGSALGAFIAMKRIRISLMAVEAGILFFIGFLYLFMLLSPEAGMSQLMIFGSMIIIGFLTGMEYPLAVNLADSSYKTVSSTAGRFYAFDLFGAFLGAIITAAVFIPTIGIKNTLLITMAIKSGSLLLVCMGKPRTRVLPTH